MDLITIVGRRRSEELAESVEGELFGRGATAAGFVAESALQVRRESDGRHGIPPLAVYRPR